MPGLVDIQQYTGNLIIKLKSYCYKINLEWYTTNIDRKSTSIMSYIDNIDLFMYTYEKYSINSLIVSI